MNWKVKSAILLAAIGLLVGGLVIWNRGHSRPPVQVVVQLRVQPPDQVDLVMAKANSARFKYLLGKISSTRPYLAQQLQLKRLPDSAQIEARIGLENRDEAKKYLEAFAAALQDFCGSQVRISLEGQTIQ
jgi:hypothetical protein